MASRYPLLDEYILKNPDLSRVNKMGRKNPRRPRRYYEHNNELNSVVCSVCASTDHPSNECTKKRCFMCAREGHGISVCQFTRKCRVCGNGGHELNTCIPGDPLIVALRDQYTKSTNCPLVEYYRSLNPITQQTEGSVCVVCRKVGHVNCRASIVLEEALSGKPRHTGASSGINTRTPLSDLKGQHYNSPIQEKAGPPGLRQDQVSSDKINNGSLRSAARRSDSIKNQATGQRRSPMVKRVNSPLRSRNGQEAGRRNETPNQTKNGSTETECSKDQRKQRTPCYRKDRNRSPLPEGVGLGISDTGTSKEKVVATYDEVIPSIGELARTLDSSRTF